MRRTAGAFLAGFVLVCGCGSDDEHKADEGKAAETKCVDDDEHCGEVCSAIRQPCPKGLFCNADGHCAKECIEDDEAAMCGGAMRCTENGACIGAKDASTQSMPDGQVDGSDGSVADPNADPACKPANVHASRVVPTVILIVDQSVSMTEELSGGVTRWQAVRDLLLDEKAGLIADLQKQVRFGLALYSAKSMDDGPLPVGECPQVTSVKPAFDNFDAISDVYLGSEPIDDGPAGDAIDKVVETFDLSNLDADSNTVFVFATDGEADRCEQLDPSSDEAEQEAVDAVSRAFALGIRTYVISVGADFVASHQQNIANAGLGLMPSDPPAEYWSATDGDALRAALTAIVTRKLECEVSLHARLGKGDECKGTVTLNGADLDCNGPDGWRRADSTHIELLGDACMELKTAETVVLDATFPCTFAL